MSNFPSQLIIIICWTFDWSKFCRPPVWISASHPSWCGLLSTAPYLCVVLWNTRRYLPPGSMETISFSTGIYYLCWLMRGIYFWYGQASISQFCGWNWAHFLNLFSTLSSLCFDNFFLSTRLQLQDKNPILVATTPSYTPLLHLLLRIWCWGCRWLTLLDWWTSRWHIVGLLASYISRLSLLLPHTQFFFLWGILYVLFWWRRQFWPIRSSISQLTCGFDGP